MSAHCCVISILLPQINLVKWLFIRDLQYEPSSNTLQKKHAIYLCSGKSFVFKVHYNCMYGDRLGHLAV